jgi:hypothetical protein
MNVLYFALPFLVFGRAKIAARRRGRTAAEPEFQ